MAGGIFKEAWLYKQESMVISVLLHVWGRLYTFPHKRGPIKRFWCEWCHHYWYNAQLPQPSHSPDFMKLSSMVWLDVGGGTDPVGCFWKSGNGHILKGTVKKCWKKSLVGFLWRPVFLKVWFPRAAASALHANLLEKCQFSGPPPYLLSQKCNHYFSF